MNNIYKQAEFLQKSQDAFLQQEKTLHLTNLIETFSDPSIKNLQSHNKNKIQRQLLDIATNFYAMIDKLQMIKWFCIDYKTTLESYKKEEIERQKQLQRQQKAQADHNMQQMIKEQKMIDQSFEGSIPLFFQQQLSLQSNPRSQTNPFALESQLQTLQQQQNPKPLIILPGKRLQTNKQQIQSTINKLKVMIVKVNTRQSSSFEHVYSTYLSRLKYTLQNSNLDEKRFKMHKIKSILNYLPKKYVILKLQAKNIYPYHPTRYPAHQLIGFQYNQSPMFFINFYVQQLLFFNLQPIPLQPGFSELLYCPIIFIKGKADESMKISGWYYDQLALIQPTWRGVILMIKVYNVQTSLKHPIYYSHMTIKKFQLPNQLKNHFDEVNKGFHFMEHKYSNEEELIGDLETIKSYIYQTLIFNHLKRLFSKNLIKDKDCKKIHFMIPGGFKIQFQLMADLELKQTLKNILNPKRSENEKRTPVSGIFQLPEKSTVSYPQPVYKSQLISDLLLFYKRKNLFTFKRPSLVQELQVLFKATVFKIITEDLEYRTVSPAYSGSLSLYYYEKRSIKKANVQNFMQNFGKK